MKRLRGLFRRYQAGLALARFHRDYATVSYDGREWTTPFRTNWPEPKGGRS